MTTSSRTLGDWFSVFERTAFRLETLDDYSQSGGVDAFHAFLTGEEQPEGYRTADWVGTPGRQLRSVAAVSCPRTHGPTSEVPPPCPLGRR
ncbi:DUF6879 family protein [Kitasatospora sp. NPDC057500]|uniref:DUF6879 family protein n=1 Tax=Kitasatospora sp. NPDC057500 TaxID=3346151 RepID=UPI0036AC002A